MARYVVKIEEVPDGCLVAAIALALPPLAAAAAGICWLLA